MLFNSYTYVLVFLPVSIVGFFLLAKYTRTSFTTYWLILVSLFFYSFWNPVYLPLLLGSILFNWIVASFFRNGFHGRKALLWVGIIGNLALLGYFKYADFFLQNVNVLFSENFPLPHLILPLAISFFTFQQIAYLVDAYRGLVNKHSFKDYLLFVIFFPQLIAGPIVHHSEMMPQFASKLQKKLDYRNLFSGIFLMTIGLFKKVVIADTFAHWVSGGFDTSVSLTLFEAWTVALAYTLQLYFDFSGYTDMAIGAARCFNIKLPLNFNSPYKAVSIQDFWRRWHMTLSRFLRDYVYIPLGGSMNGEGRTLVNVGTVFVLGGLWHGAGWTFVVWGALHGAATVILLVWRRVGFTVSNFFAWCLTFTFVTVTWVFFRAQTFSDALRVLRGMVGLDGISFPSSLHTVLLGLDPMVDFNGIYASGVINAGYSTPIIVSWVLVGMAIVFWAPNSMNILEKLKPTMVTWIILMFMLLVSLYNMSFISEFIYFQF